MKHTNQKLKLIGILTPILILAGIILIALTGNKVNILKTQVAEETGKITQETETAKVYDAYMLINELSKIDGTDLNGNGNGIKITTSADDLTLKAYSVVNDELISENENKDIIVPESGIKLKVEGITEGKTYEIEIANGTTDAEYKTDFVKAVITIDATGEDSLVAYVKETTKVVNGEEITEEGSKEETAIFMYEDETNKIKIKGNGDLEMYYTLGSLDGLTEEELKTATWKEYDKTNGLEVEHNCKIYAKSKYKTGEYSDISEIRVDNIDKLAPTITVTGKEEKAEESTSVTVKITDEENEKYGASGIVAYKMTKMETEPKEWIEIENTKEYETEIGEIQKNGTYYLWAKDKVGNVGHVSFDVTNIEVKVVAVILDSPVESLIGTEYTSLEALQTALEENNITAESGKVIVQLENNVYYETMKIANKDITIDLNGYMIKAKTEEPVIDVESGKVNLVDGKYKFADYITNTEKAEELAGKYTAQNDYGKIINETGNGINIEEGAEFTLGTDDELISIASPEIKAGETGIHNNNGTFNFYDGIITAKITNDGSTTVEGEKVETGITDTPRLYDPTTRQTEGEEGKYTTYLAKVSGIEAVIGKTRYTKLEYAIEAANDLKGTPETQVRIDIVKDINKDASIEINNTKNIILNLNGYTLTNSVADYVIKNAGKLEITDTTVGENHVYDNNDETTIKGKILTTTGGVIDNQEGAELTITEGTIYSSYTNNNVFTPIINNNSKLTINGGYIKTTTRNKRGIYNLENGTVEINGGKMYSNNYYFRAIENAATGTESAQVVINNTEITVIYGDSYIFNADNGIIDIKGGIFNIDLYQYGTGTMNISGGENTWTLYNEKGIVNISDNAKLRYLDTRRDSITNITGGEITTNNSRAIYARSNSIVNISNSKITSSNGQAIYTQENSSLSVENSIITSSAETIYDTSTAGIKIKNSTITSTANSDYNGYVIRNSNSGTIEIDNSVINSTNQRGIYNENSGTIKIQTNDKEGKMIIQANKEGIFNGANGTIVLGVKDGEIQNELIEIDSNTYGLNNNRSVGIIKYYDGTIVGKNKGILGVINDIEDNSEITLSIVNEKEQAQLGNNEAVCYIGENDTNTYDSIASAIENIETEGKITLLKNIVISANNSIEIPEGKKITLDIKGKEIEIHKYEKAILNNGELTIKDSVTDSTGKIYGYANNGMIVNSEDKTLTIESGKIIFNQYGDNSSGVVNEGEFIVNGGILESLNQSNYCINNKGITTINGGSINANADSATAIYNSGELIVNDGSINAVYYRGTRSIENAGKTTIKGGAIDSKENYWGTSMIYNYNELYIEGGKITSSNLGIYNGKKDNLIGILKMTSGEITTGGNGIQNSANIKIIYGTITSSNVGIYNENQVTNTEINGGSITAEREAIYNTNGQNDGILTITGGKITSNQRSAIYNNCYNDKKTVIKVTGGEIESKNTRYNDTEPKNTSGIYSDGYGEVILGENDEGVPSQENPKITGTNYGVYTATVNNKFYFYDGIITGKSGQSIYGKVTEIPIDYTIQKYKTGEKENIEVAEGMESAILDQINIAKIESTGIEYPSLRKAINAITETDTITILQNFEIPQTESFIKIASEKNITINLNGKKITASNENTIINEGILTIIDNEETLGTIINNYDTLILNKENGNLNINNGTLEMQVSSGKKLINNQGTMTINRGTINANADSATAIYNSGELIVNDGSINAVYYRGTRSIENAGKTTIKGGTIDSKENYWGTSMIYNYNELYIEGGKITSSNLGIYNGKKDNLIGILKMTSGEITTGGNGIQNSANIKIIYGTITSSNVGIYNENQVTNTEINGGSITAEREAIYNTNGQNDGILTITGGKITSNQRSAIYNNCYNDKKTVIKVTGGEIESKNTRYNDTEPKNTSGIYSDGYGEVILGENDEGVPSQENPKITGTNYGVYTATVNNKFYFYDGIITGKSGQSIYGKVTEIPIDYTIQKYKTGENEDIEVADEMESSILENTNVVRVESSKNTYIYLKDAIENAESTDTITVLKDFTIPTNEENSTVSTGKDITINLNGKKIIASNENTIINEGTLTIIDNEETTGTIINNYDTLILNKENGNLNINNGNMEMQVSSGKKLINNEGTMTINGGNINANADSATAIYNSGELIVNDGSINAVYYRGTRSIENAGKTTIKGGTIDSKENSYGTSVIYNYNELYIEGGKITSSNLGIYNGKKDNLIGILKMTSGEITTGGNGIQNSANIKIIYGTITSSNVGIYNENQITNTEIDGGSITAEREAIYNTNGQNDGTLTITGGKITSNQRSAIYNNCYNDKKTVIKVTGGEIESKNTRYNDTEPKNTSGIYSDGYGEVILGENDEGIPNQESPKITGTTYGVYTATANNKFYFYDGIITGGTLAIYGTVTGTPESYMVVYKDSSQKIAVLDKVADFDNQICVDGTYYDTLDSAIAVITNKANKTGRILLYSDVELLTPATIPEGVNITLEMQGQRMLYRSGTDAAITNNGTLTIIDYADLSDGDSDTISSIENTQGIAIQNNGILTIGQANNNNMTSPKIIGTTAIAGNEATKLSGTITNTNSTVGMAQSRQIAKIQKMEENNQTANDTKIKLSSTPDLIVESTEWTKENVPVGMRADITPILNLYLVENIKTAEYKVEYYYDGKIDESKTFTDEVDIGTQINSYEDKVKEGYVLEKVEGMPLTVEENTDNNIIKVYYTKRIDLSYTVNYLEKGTNKIIHESKTVTDKTYGDTVQATQEIIEIDGYNYESSDKETLTITTEGNEINIYYIKKKDLRYTVNYLEKGTNKVLYEAKTYNNQVFETKINAVDEAININGYKYDSSSVETLTIGTGENVINIYYTKVDGLSYTINYLEKYTNKVLHEPETKGNQTFENEITSRNEVIEIDGYNYESTDPETLVIGTTDNIINIYYTKRNDLSYTVNYLEKETDKVLHEVKVVENKTFEEVVTSSNEIIEIDGYYYDSVDPETLVVGTNENIINIYYTKRNDLSYTVNYLEKDTNKVLHDSKVVENKTFEDVVTSSDEIIEINGYNYDSIAPETLVIGTNENIINIYYTKRNDLSYTVKYIDRDTKEEIQEEKIVTGKTYKETVNAEEEKTEIYGYNYETADPEVLTIEVENNVINLYYTRKTSTVVIKHCEEGTEQQISENVVITGKVGEKYKAEIAEDIPEKYEFTRAEGETEGTITEEPQTITMYYSKKATKVIVNYINEETQEKMKDSEGQEIESIEIEGKVDDFYTTVSSIKIPSKYELVEIPENSAGRMTIDEIIVNYYYRRKETRVVVHHYEEGTTNKLSENIVITGKVDDTYETKAATDIPVKYEYAYVEGDTAGIMTEEEIHIFYYYKVKESKLTVRYVDKNHDTEIIQADETIGKVDDKYETQAREIEGYTLVGNSENTEGTLKVEATEVIYYYKKNTAVQVKYIDIDTDEELSQETIEGLEGDEYQTESKNFEKYVLVKETENTEGTMTREEIIVKYYYEHLSKGVIEKHIDITTNEILENKVYTGKYGTPYTTKVKTIEGYDVVEERLPENAEGTMIEDVIEVNYYYIAKAKINVEYIDRATGKNLDISDVIIGHEGDTYQTEEKTFEGYDLIEIVGNAEGTMTKGETTIKYIYARPTKVIVRYIDQITGKNLVTSSVGGDVPGDPITIIGHEGDAYQTEEKTITGYDLVKTSENTEGTMAKEDIEVTYYYIAKTKVLVNYIDRVTGESLITSDIDPIIITGHEGDTYKTESKTFAGYDLVKTSENTEGRMTKETIEVTYYYARPAKVIVNYLDEETGKTIENIKEEIITGYEGDSYKTEAKELEYYRVARTSENTEGIMEVRVEKEIIDNTTIVNYYYKKKDYNFSIEKTLESIKKDEKTTEITGTIGKIELTKGQLKTAKVQVVYNIKVKNTGEIAGKVKVLEKIAAGMKMNKEDNPGWEISNTVATIETNEIEPGKEENIKVVLTWINSETNLGTIENIAEIQDTSSKSGFKDNNSKDDTDKVDIIVAISTGEKTYMSIMGVILIILSSASVVLVMKQKNN